MATTAGTNTPLVPVGGEGTTIGGETDEIELGGTVAIGDILDIVGAGGAVNNSNVATVAVASTPTGVIGVAMQAGVDGDFIQYAPAYPGRKFEANIVNNVTDTAAQSDNTLLQDMHGTIESAQGFCCLDSASTAEVAIPMGWGRQTQAPMEGRRMPWPSVTNPRVIFIFGCSVFAVSA